MTYQVKAILKTSLFGGYWYLTLMHGPEKIEDMGVLILCAILAYGIGLLSK